jgi:hypothetical protein
MSIRLYAALFWATMTVALAPPVLAESRVPDMETLSEGIWVNRTSVQSLPTGGPGWTVLERYAERPLPQPDLSDNSQDDPANIVVFAKALYYARTGVDSYREQVIDACREVIGTEKGGGTLQLGRKLISYVLAADLVGLPNDLDARFRDWLAQVLSEKMADERTLRETHELRPNNWGTLAGASRVATAAYLGDAAEVARVATIFKGWLGDRSSYAGFEYKDLDWQADPARPVGINPPGSTKEGHSIDGVLPEEMRRSGAFTWPPPKENYVYTALQGAVATAVILHRAGYDAFGWQDAALLRAYRWLQDQAAYPAEGDDTWMTYVINAAYNREFFTEVANDDAGKNVGFTEWTLAADRFLPLRSSWRHLAPPSR